MKKKPKKNEEEDLKVQRLVINDVDKLVMISGIAKVVEFDGWLERRRNVKVEIEMILKWKRNGNHWLHSGQCDQLNSLLVVVQVRAVRLPTR